MGDGAGTFANQGKLPKLPLPELEATCDKYLRTVQPLLTEHEFEATKACVAEFAAGDGVGMHEALCEYRDKVDNYIEEFWDKGYLEYDAPLVLNVNPIFVLEDDPTPSRNSQVARASSLLLSSIKFVRALRQGTLSPDMARTTPLCMSQFAHLFSSARVPVFEDAATATATAAAQEEEQHAGEGGADNAAPASQDEGESRASQPKYLRDRVVTYEGARHVVVMCRGQFYYFDVVWPDGTVAITEREICKNLERILVDAKKKSVDEQARDAVGVLTAEERHVWATTRRQLEQLSRNNERTLRVIDSALFVLCLDHTPTTNVDEIAANVLHGTYEIDDCGRQTGSCINRWYDKLQIVVTATGNAGVNFEHSAVDGHTVLRFASDVFTDTVIRFAQTISGPRVHSFISEGALACKAGRSEAPHTHKDAATLASTMRRPETRPRKLEFDLGERERHEISFAERRLSDLIQQNEVCCLEFTGYGKQYIVQNSMSPDAFVQLAIQSAYHEMYGRVVNTYESVQTKAFLHGRTEAARSATLEAAAFVRLWKRKGTEVHKRVEALRAAIKTHSQVTREASQGMGVDRHLLAMKMLFEKQHPGEPLPAIFRDKAWSVLSTNVLSTSNCGNPSLRFFGFGPVTPQGFGVGYIIKDEAIHFCVTSKHRQTDRFIKTLRHYLGEVQDALLSLEPSYNTARSMEISRSTEEDDQGYGFFGDDLNEYRSHADSGVGHAF
ncbi:Putative mitochondrial carnitine O-acetyltransferase [Durusdinium trenchii]|uniref:Mitochondrial carnitine O-acetyltransferase n=1 Tax=Durusdinium trenchii TaxID=1381693 RepID=A0ABP0L656_9DINO